MEKRQLGNSEIEISRLTLGTMTFGGQVDEPTARTMVDRCLERGINSIDTANVIRQACRRRCSDEFLRGFGAMA